MPTKPDFIEVTELKKHLNKTTDDDDQELSRFVSAACRMIEERMGYVSPVEFEEEHDTFSSVIVLDQRPVVSVESIKSLVDLTELPKRDRVNGTQGWYLSNPEGVVTSTLGFPGRVLVSYTAGRDPVPENFEMAALELAAHDWRGSQNASGGTRPSIGEGDESVIPGQSYAYALPIRVREYLGLGKNPTDHYLVG